MGASIHFEYYQAHFKAVIKTISFCNCCWECVKAVPCCLDKASRSIWTNIHTNVHSTSYPLNAFRHGEIPSPQKARCHHRRVNHRRVRPRGLGRGARLSRQLTIIMTWVSKERVNMAVSSDVLSSGVLTPWLIGHMTPQMIDVSTCEISTIFENKSSASANYRLENHQEIFHAKTDGKTARLENRRQNWRAVFGACWP